VTQCGARTQGAPYEITIDHITPQGDKLSPEALDTLKRQIETKQKALERSGQDFQEEAGNQQNDIAQRILQKMAPMIVTYAQKSGFGMIVDTSKPWPQSPVLWYDGERIDVTKPVVDAYNAQSNVPPPAAGAAKPPAAKPATGASTTPKAPAPKPAEPAATDLDSLEAEMAKLLGRPSGSEG